MTSMVVHLATKRHWLVESCTISQIRPSATRSEIFILCESKRVGRQLLQSAAALPFFQIETVFCCQLPLTFALSWLKNLVSHSFARHLDFLNLAPRSLGPVALPRLVIFKVSSTSVSSTSTVRSRVVSDGVGGWASYRSRFCRSGQRSRHGSLAVRRKMVLLIVDVKKHLKACSDKLIMMLLTIVPLEFLVDIILKSGFCNGNDLLLRLLRHLWAIISLREARFILFQTFSGLAAAKHLVGGVATKPRE